MLYWLDGVWTELATSCLRIDLVMVEEVLKRYRAHSRNSRALQYFIEKPWHIARIDLTERVCLT
jgi:hypothetical protein